MMQTQSDKPYDPNDPSTWQDPSGNPVDPSQARASLLNGVSADPGPATGEATPRVSKAATSPSDGTAPPDDPMPTERTGPPAPTHGGIIDPGTGDATVGQPTVAPSPPPPGPAPLPPPSIGPTGDTTAYNAKLRAFLLSNLGDLSTPTDETSPEIAPSLSAYRNQSTRDEQAFRDAAAERFYAKGEGGGEGLSSGGFDTALTGGMEAAAANRSNFAGNLVWNASQMKRQQLQAMMQTAVNAGETDAAQQIQSQIAAMDASLRGRGLDQQNSQFNDSLAKQYADLQAQMNRDQMLAALRP